MPDETIGRPRGSEDPTASYEAPRVERVLTSEALARDIPFAGFPSIPDDTEV